MKNALLIATLFCSTAILCQDSVTAKIPFEGMDLTWINGQNRQMEFPLKYKDILTGVAYLDCYYNLNFAEPIDHTQTISSTMGRTNEFTLNLASVGLETNYGNIIGRLWFQTGNTLHIVQELDGTVSRGRNTGTGNLKFIREASAGYHFDVLYGLNVEMGIFMSYIGLESYVTQENWSYQRSMVSDFTPFYFQGARIQLNPAKKFQTQLWLLNGWQTYNSLNEGVGLGNSNYFRPTDDLQLVANFYYGKDTRGSDLIRFHHDNSVVARYHKRKHSRRISQCAFSINSHYGFQSNDSIGPSDHFMMGTAIANRVWFNKNKLALTLRGDYVTNPGLYLAYSPSPVAPNDFTAAIANDPEQKLEIVQAAVSLDVMPNDFVTFRLEYAYRRSNVPYFAGPGGTTSPDGWIDTPTTNWRPDLTTTENRLTAAVNFRL
jgi:Putative beta-barrel porin-2, OmpL-like. bbp2